MKILWKGLHVFLIKPVNDLPLFLLLAHLEDFGGCVANDFNTLKDSQAQVVFLALFPCDVVTGKEGKLWETNGCLCEVGF